MAYDVIRPADHEGWLAERAKGIGSSDAGTIMGVSPFSKPLRLWQQKMGLAPPIEETASMRNGHYLEKSVAEFFAGETGATIDYTSEGDWLAVDRERPWLRVSPDRMFWAAGTEKTQENRLVLELKSTSKFVDPENLPLYWQCQVQYQMGVLGVRYGAIAWITSQPKLEMGYVWVKFNPAFFKTLTDAIDKFWKENILGGVQPEPEDEEDCAIKWPTSETDKIALADANDLERCKYYNRLIDQRNELDELIASTATDIKKRIADAECLVYTDPDSGKTSTIARFKSINETVFDEASFEENEPEEYLKYLKNVFDKNLLKEEDKIRFNKYSQKKKGSRRFSVIAKD